MAHFGTTDAGQALVIVPTYNERASIGEAARRLFEAAGDAVDLLVIDDGSPDGTAQLIKELSTGPHGVHLIERPGKLGLGSAYVTGFRWALERDYPAIVQMDADLSHDPADVTRLVAALNEAELVIGSRYIEGGEIRNWGPLRRMLSRGGNLYARAWMGWNVRDATSGFRALRTEWLRNQDLSTIASDGYVFQIEIVRRVLLSGGRVVEVPIVFTERLQGESKIDRRIVLEALVRVPRWGVSDLAARALKR